MVLELGFWQFRPANLKLPNFKVAERHTFDLVYTALVQQRLGAVLQGIILSLHLPILCVVGAITSPIVEPL